MLNSHRAVLLALSAACANAAAASSNPYVLFPWLCLERCGDNATAIAEQVNQLVVNASLFTGVSFEGYDLGANSTLVYNNFSRVAPAFAAAGLGQRQPMITTVSLQKMRQLFANPQPFIDSAIAALRADPSINGYNIDFEPEDDPMPTAADAAAYAHFLDTFGKQLHAAGSYQLTVAVALWSPLWNLTLIGATDVDFVIQMGTYIGNFSIWQHEFAELLANVPVSKAVVGLETTDDDQGGRPFTDAELALRFNAIEAAGVRAVGIWASPIPDNWWPFLRGLRGAPTAIGDTGAGAPPPTGT